MNIPENHIYLGTGAAPQYLNLKYANRHGLIAGATGTGKTVSLQIMAEQFSDAGVPVFMADVKGDLSGISQAGKTHDKLEERATKIGLDDYAYKAFPTVFWDIFGKQGHPIRITISEMGPLLLSRLLDLNSTQEGVLNVAFAVADDDGMLLLDLKDLRSLLQHIGDNAKELNTEYGFVSKATVGAIQRALLAFEQQGGEHFFGEPALELNDMMRTTMEGKGIVNILASDVLIRSPKLYSTFLLWMLSELFETLPEVGDPTKPKLVFFFDEAHLLFNDAPKALVEKIEQVVRLIRSKGVSVFFVTQNPLDLPVEVLGQLGNRVQHALRAFTPRDQKAVKVAAETFRQNPEFDTAQAITELGIGEALVSTLESKGKPSIVDRTLIRPPSSRLGPATAEERQNVMSRSPVSGKYENAVDRESAFEKLQKRAEEAAKEAEKAEEEARIAEERKPKRRSNRQGYIETALKSVIRTVSTNIGRQIVRGVLGSIFKGR